MPQDTPSRLLRAGIVGTGGIARAHGRACRELDGIELRAVCDISEHAVNRFGDEFGVARRYLGVDQMLAAEDLDIAIICTWGAHHAQTGIQIATSGRARAILCEKPLTSNAAEAVRLVAAAREHGVLIAEAFKFRHHPMHLKAKALVDAGAIGDVVTIRSTFYLSGDPAARQPDKNWRWNRAQGGGSIYDLACYGIHHARFIFDAEPWRVFATAQMEGEIDVAAFLLLVFPGNRTAQLSVGYNAWPAHYAEICGSRGMLRLDRVWNNEDQPVSLEHRTQEETVAIEFPPMFQFTEQLRHLCECLSTGQPHRIPPEHSIRQMRVIDAAFESILTGTAVDVPDLNAPGAGDLVPRHANRPT